MNDEPEMDGDDLVRQTDLLIQQLAAARASSGVPASPAKQQHEGSIPNVVTFGLPDGGDEDGPDDGSGKNDHGTLSTADVTGDAYQDDDDDVDGGDGDDSSASSEGEYQDAVQGSASSDGGIQPRPQDLDYLAQTSAKPTALRAKIMEKYGREGSSSSNIIGGSQQHQQIPSSITSSSSQSKKKKKNKADKKKRKEGGSSSRKKKTSGSRKSTSPRDDAHDSITTASANYGYGADYAPSMSTSTPAAAPARTPSTRAPPTAIPTTPQIYAGGYQGTPNESLQEAMRQAEIAEDAARRMREAVSVHQMDRDGGSSFGGGGMPGFGSSGPGRYGPSPNPGSARVGASYLETGATACIRELLSCLADPLAALAGDNSAPAGSSVTGFGGMEDPHPRWARASGNYEYVPVPNIRHQFGGGDAPAAAASQDSAGGGFGSGGHAADDNAAGTGKHESETPKNDRSDAASERKGLLSGTGYDSNW